MISCPCGSDQGYAECCEPLHTGVRRAPTAEVLMRSRYSAYVKHRLDYLYETILPRSRKNHDPESARDWSRSSTWLGLEILHTSDGGPTDQQGTVEFVARYRRDGEQQEHREIATFVRDGEDWYFDDGRIVGPEPEVRESPKVQRNDPCPCGSGKKYKKCCA